MTDQGKIIENLKAALLQIGNLPLEFNTRARGIAQRAINRLGGSYEWRDTLTEEQIFKAVDRGGVYKIPKEAAPMSAETTETNAAGSVPYTPPEIEMIPVESSNIESVGHDGVTTLRVKFKGSGSYDYRGVSESDFFDLVNAPSVGKAYGALTRAKGIKGIKLAPEA